jgi:hypothetical protein
MVGWLVNNDKKNLEASGCDLLWGYFPGGAEKYHEKPQSG